MFSHLKPLVVTLALGAAAIVEPRATSEAPKTLSTLSERELVSPLVGDIRWLDDEAVAIAAYQEGVLRLPLAPRDALQERLVPGGRGSDGVWIAARLAVSEKFLAVAAPLFEFTWWDRNSGRLAPTSSLEAILDLDLHGDRLLVLGAEKGENTMAPDGALAWIGSLADGWKTRRPVHFSKDGPGAPRVGCAAAEMGAVRFLSDGSFVVVPGIEPGVFWYEPDGKLRRTWETGALDIDDACPDDENRRDDIAAHPGARTSWMNRNRLVNDIVALPAGFGLLVRDPISDYETRWRLLQLQRDGSVVSWQVPVRGTTGLSYLKADVRGQRIAFLVVEFGVGKPKALPRLVVTDLPR